MTLLSKAGSGKITKEMEIIAKKEGVDSEYIRKSIAEGVVVIPYNKKHKSLEVLSGIGKGLRTKVNTNIGTSPEHVSLEKEIEKLDVAIKAGTDTVMDLSIGGDIDKIRRAIIDRSPVPVGTVPIYQAAVEFAKRKGIVNMTEDYIFNVIEKQAEDGVDFMTVHCGVTRESIKRLRNQGRILDIVSRGGAFLVVWMLHNKKENPLFENYDRLLEIAKKYD
ncbi:unnamed protein product, partial [marine sediment metagenome]